MNELEQHPLLYDSDEESNVTCPRKHRRGRYPAYGGRARARVKGAAFIMKHWPDHVSSLMTYCWIGFSMIAVTIFFIYNSVAIVDVVTPTHVPVVPTKADNNEDIENVDITSALDIFMHIFVESYEEMNDNFYLKYIQRIAKKFTDYRYNLIMVLMDVPKSQEKEISSETNNDVAMRYILNADKIYRSEHWSDISIQFISLSNYLDSSPVKDYWRDLPLHILEFLTRCISIWDKGGIAFNPIILTPLSPNFRYMENLQNTLKKYKKISKQNKQKENKNTIQSERKLMPKVNNIQDIISILENNNNESGNIPQYNLSEADNKKESYYINMTNHREMVNSGKFKREIINNNISSQDIMKKYENIRVNTDISINNNQTPDTNRSKNDNSTGKPLFWNKIFRNTSQTFEDVNDKLDELSFDNSGEVYAKLDNITVQQSFDSSDMLMHISDIKHKPELTIDLKGNLIATKTPCHAFIGTIFSNIRHYSSKDSIKDIITDELSIFCKGLLSSCKYIDVILL